MLRYPMPHKPLNGTPSAQFPTTTRTLNQPAFGRAPINSPHDCIFRVQSDSGYSVIAYSGYRVQSDYGTRWHGVKHAPAVYLPIMAKSGEIAFQLPSKHAKSSFEQPRIAPHPVLPKTQKRAPETRLRKLITLVPCGPATGPCAYTSSTPPKRGQLSTTTKSRWSQN